jgi:hypothetical protein
VTGALSDKSLGAAPRPTGPANRYHSGRQIASSEQAGILDRRHLARARHRRQAVRVWIEPTAKQLDTVVAIGDLDRFAAPAQLWDELQVRFPELLRSSPSTPPADGIRSLRGSI